MDTRTSLHAGLLRSGVRASLPVAFHPEQVIGAGKSLGIIEVDLGPVRWINVRRLNEEGAEVYRADLGVPDVRMHRFPDVEHVAIHSVPGKHPPARWAGDDLDLGIIEALNRDPALQDELPPAGRSTPDIFSGWREDERLRIRAHPEQRCWTLSFAIETKETSVLGLFGGRRLRIPQPAELDAYQQIGRILLNSRLNNYWESGERITA
jgi:hypothetical protein